MPARLTRPNGLRPGGRQSVGIFAFTPAPMIEFECRHVDRTSTSFKTLYTGINTRLPNNLVPRLF